MFTGIVQALGRVVEIENRATTRRFVLAAPDLSGELAPGDSVAVDGACLTVTDVEEGGFAVDVIGTTLERTIAGRYVEGSPVNLERAMILGSRLDGHLVQGHIDGVAELMQCMKDGEFWRLDVRLPEEVAHQTVPRGSIALNGVSLTVAEMPGPLVCRIGLIPYTFENTNLGVAQPGDALNVEGDLIGKYVGKILAERIQ